MMRYRIDEETSLIAEASITYDFIFFSAMFGILVGIVMAWAAWHGKRRQWWLFTWSAGLVLASMATIVFL
ncbi:hypothetical protein [Thioalkalivibrio sp. HK1]|uniref:hypothetical protein n=1 Tax=Thioalkalivibrio sp. HK1 TaxID=1469245 RepID=UPI00046FBD82|nr:hypothetical protein [Thioalkalivibrio sp. HK1]